MARVFCSQSPCFPSYFTPSYFISLSPIPYSLSPIPCTLTLMSHEKILIVEDEEEIRELVAYNLVKQGYRVIPAETGEEGLRLVRSEPPDLIVLDLMLPGVDGLEVCRTLKRIPRPNPSLWSC